MFVQCLAGKPGGRTRAPYLASSKAMAFPIPREEPVTMQTGPKAVGAVQATSQNPPSAVLLMYT